MAKRRIHGTIRKLPSGRYQARYWKLGKQVSAPDTFATKADANLWLSTVAVDQHRGQFVEPDSGKIPFGDFARNWLDHRPLRPRTRDTYESQLSHINARFEQARLDEITPRDVRAWHSSLFNSDLHPNTIAKVYRLMRTILDTAVDDGLLRSNPVHIKGAAVEKAIERPLVTWDEVARLATAIEPRLSSLVWTAAISGLRFGELTGLARRHLDLTKRTITVERALMFNKGKGVVFGPPKSNAAYRSVVVPDVLVGMLEQHLADYVRLEPDALVFTSLQGRPLLNRYFAPLWARAKKAVDIDQSVRFHDLRHLAGTAAATAGASLKEVMARMGQSSPDAAHAASPQIPAATR